MAIGVLTNALPWQDEQTERDRGRYYGRRLGFVRDRNDPAKLGRIRAHVPSLFAEEDNEENWVDWCLPASPGLTVPPLNAPVFIDFEQGFVTHGVYSWGWLLGADPASSAAPTAGKGLAVDNTWLKDETFESGGTGPAIKHTLTQDPARASLPKYPYDKVYQSEGGFIIEVDDSPGQPRARLLHPSGATILIDSDGSIHVRTPGSIFQESGGDHVIALKPGSTFKVIYPGGTSMSCGGGGFQVTGHQATILDRTVERVPQNI